MGRVHKVEAWRVKRRKDGIDCGQQLAMGMSGWGGGMVGKVVKVGIDGFLLVGWLAGWGCGEL